MKTQFALDVRLARRKAGLTQGDVAHLLCVHQSVVSEFEHGKRRPSLEQIVDLSLIYGRSFESLFDALLRERKRHLTRQVRRLPKPARLTADTVNRASSLRKLKRRLAEPPRHDAG